MRQCLPTVLIPFDARHQGAVEAVLEGMREPPGGCLPSIKQALDQVETVHFMSISVIADAEPDASRAFLVLEAAADGETDAALAAIASALCGPLRELLHKADLAEQAPDLTSYLMQHECGLGQGWSASTLGLPFNGTPGLSVRRIRREADLAFDIADMRDLMEKDTDALSKLEEVRARLWQRGDSKWAFVAEEAPHLDYVEASSGGARFNILPRVLGTLLWPVLIAVPFMFIWSFWLVLTVLLAVGAGVLARFRQLERSNEPETAAADAACVHEVMERENITTQNMLITVSTMQAGWVRRFALRVAFVFIGQIAAHWFRPGFLANLGTIHFARWLLLPGGRTLVFLSHYDGSLESYLEDFIQEAHQGISGIWSNAVGFPRTRWLFFEGAQDGDRLRRYVLRQQRPVRFCYSAYPSRSISRIRANAAICRGIAAVATVDEAEEWLACFGASGRLLAARHPARPRAIIPTAVDDMMQPTPAAPLAALETDSIPTLLFGARKHLAHATVLLVRFGSERAAIREWLGGVAPQVTYGKRKHMTKALALALAASAFDRECLALRDDERASFAPAFLNGMSSPARARALGDVGDNAPDRWKWGGSERVDAVLILYDVCRTNLAKRVQDATEDADEYGHAVTPIPLQSLGDKGLVEPFGFVDGVSQPKIRGIHDDEAVAGTALLEPGEFVLGYRDNRGYLPLSPWMAACRDRTGALHRIEDGRCDLGRNGSYFVMRQLQQDVAGFGTWQRETAIALRRGTSSLASVPACLATELVGAKMVGRWKNGSALAQHTVSPGSKVRNEFLYGTVDAAGLGCPLGAHTRRANPRDSFNPGSDRQLALTNRHRIVRVGRPYQPEEGRKPGLMFMALNADIGRQFEFIQQTWLLGRNFHGLDGEVDPLFCSGDGHSTTFTVHTSQGPLRLPLQQPFIRVLGGEYFFMPGRQALNALIAAAPAGQAPVNASHTA